jgi:hypothetical protein
VLEEFLRIAQEAIESATESATKAAQRDRDVAREVAAESRTKLAKMSEQYDRMRAELALARAWIAQTSNKSAFEMWLAQARVAR